VDHVSLVTDAGLVVSFAGACHLRGPEGQDRCVRARGQGGAGRRCTPSRRVHARAGQAARVRGCGCRGLAIIIVWGCAVLLFDSVARCRALYPGPGRLATSAKYRDSGRSSRSSWQPRLAMLRFLQKCMYVALALSTVSLRHSSPAPLALSLVPLRFPRVLLILNEVCCLLTAVSSAAEVRVVSVCHRRCVDFSVYA
jgi:hypothetical protein